MVLLLGDDGMHLVVGGDTTTTKTNSSASHCGACISMSAERGRDASLLFSIVEMPAVLLGDMLFYR